MRSPSARQEPAPSPTKEPIGFSFFILLFSFFFFFYFSEYDPRKTFLDVSQAVIGKISPTRKQGIFLTG